MKTINSVLYFTSFLVLLAAVQSAPQPQANQNAYQNAINAANSRDKGFANVDGSFNPNPNNLKNWNAGVRADAGFKAWQSNNKVHNIGVGFNAQQQFGREQGHSWRSKPDFGVGVAYSGRFGK